MGTTTGLLLAAALAAPVELDTLAGETHRGEFVGLSAEAITLSVDGAERAVPVEDLLDVRFPETEGLPGSDREKYHVRLADGTRFDAESVIVTEAGGVQLKTVRLGELELPLRTVSAIRFPKAEAEFDEAWQKLRSRAAGEDLLVVRKTKVLDHLKGVVGEIDSKAVKFLISGSEIPVGLEKVYGVVYARRDVERPELTSVVSLAGDDRLPVTEITYDGEAFTARIPSGRRVTFGLDEVESLDFSLGKVQYLSQMEPEDLKYTPYFDDFAHRDLIRLRKDRNQSGKPIRIGREEFTRGLWLHPKTTVRYRLAGEYRTFAAVLGIEAEVAYKNISDARVEVLGDGKRLFAADVTGSDDPQSLELDVSGVNFLEIQVDFGRDEVDIADHVAFGDARVLK